MPGEHLRGNYKPSKFRPDSKNRVALHGLAGLFVGAVLSFAIFADGFVVDLLLVSLGLSGPILGATSGLAVGYVRNP